ncbi:hypothetical protein ACFV5G_37810 [Streptomyces sp. NPDC059766]|uniref:hypothetical protein n=1 Tax=Streptomyces sp. NPDC059766 TaxID=3346940 RepID=UPI0036682CE2
MPNLRDLVELVVRDLSVAIEPRPSVTYSGPDGQGYVKILVEDGSGMGVGFTVDPTASRADILYEMAYRIPDAYVELYAVGLPVVPGTERPATPRVVADAVVWVDPSERTAWSCPVGEYGQALEGRHEGD